MKNNFEPDWASPPGETIVDILQERELSRKDFAAELDHSEDEVERLLKGELAITLEVARRLETSLGGSFQFWLSRDFDYRQDLARREHLAYQWFSDLPIREMVDLGWIESTPSPSVMSCLNYFNVSSVSEWNDKYTELQQVIRFRTSASFQSTPAAVAAWLRQGEIEASRIQCGEWNPNGFRDCLSRARKLTREKNRSRFLPALKALCAEFGVAVIDLRAPKGCKASGATRFLSPTKAVLLLSFRHKSDDQVWFTFFHEAAHLLLHGKERLFLEGDEVSSTLEEKEADAFAGDILIPQQYRGEMMTLPLNYKSVIRFAMRVGISAGLVIGQLQHLGHIKYSQLNKAKRFYDWEE
jgi:HTH-type transcriptional regulator/antitoxin HigA